MITTIFLVMAMQPLKTNGQTPPPAWQTDLNSDSEMEHESDGLTDIRMTITQKSSPFDVGLAITLMSGIVGCMVLASNRIQALRANKNDPKIHE